MRTKSTNSLDLQTYELGLSSHKLSKSLALKTITERMDDSSKEDDVENEVAFLAKNFRKFLKIKNSGKSFSKGRFSSPKVTGMSSRRETGRILNPLKESCATNAMYEVLNTFKCKPKPKFH